MVFSSMRPHRHAVFVYLRVYFLDHTEWFNIVLLIKPFMACRHGLGAIIRNYIMNIHNTRVQGFYL